MTLNEFIEKNMTASGYVVASLTDRYIVDIWPTKEGFDEKKVLEIRIFNDEMENRLFRTDISKPFQNVLIDDEDKEFMDEWQYLDIDTKKSASIFKENQMVFTTGGGKYKLPLEKMENAGVLVRTYFGKSKATGSALITGFRLVTLGEVKSNG